MEYVRFIEGGDPSRIDTGRLGDLRTGLIVCMASASSLPGILTSEEPHLAQGMVTASADRARERRREAHEGASLDTTWPAIP